MKQPIVMRTLFIFVLIALSQISYGQNKFSVESGIDVSFFSKSGLFLNTDRLKTGIIIKSSYRLYEKNNFSASLGLSFKKGSSLDEFLDYSSDPNQNISLPIYNSDGHFRIRDEYYNIQIPVYTSLSFHLSNNTSLLVSLDNHINLLSSSRKEFSRRGDSNSISERNTKIYFGSFLNPGINISLIIKELYKVGVYAQLNNLPEEHKSIGLLVGFYL